MYTELYKQVTKRSAFPYLISEHIYEYDLSKANISCLLYYNLIDQNKFNYYCNIDKRLREISIGNWRIADSRIGEAIDSGVIEAKRLLCEANHIQDQEIFEIRNDAIFILNRELRYTDFGIFKFKKKNDYNSFLQLRNIELFHAYHPVTQIDTLDVKGIDDDKLEWHRDGWVPFFLNIFYFIENGLLPDAIQYTNKIYEDLLLKKTDLNLYREFNSDSLFRIEGIISDYQIDVITYDYVNQLSIKENILMLRVLSSILSIIYFQNIKK